MSDFDANLRDKARKLQDEWRSEPDIQEAAASLIEAADEIERLRGVLVEANNRWRHDFIKEVEDSADKLFKKLSAHRTDPFARKVA